MCCCCLKPKTPEETYRQGLQLLYAVKDSNLQQRDIRALIVALKTLKSAADQDHAGAAYMFGDAVWKCEQVSAIVAIVKAFQDTTHLQRHEYNSYGKKPVLLDYRRALAQRYLLQAHASAYTGSQHKLNEIEQYALTKSARDQQDGLIDLQILSYQKF